MDNRSSKLSEAHHRRISTTFTMVDKAICEFEQWIGGKEAKSVLFEEVNAIDATQREQISQEVSVIRELLVNLKSDLGLEVTQQYSTAAILSRCATLWANVIDLEPRKLERYGPMPEDLAKYLEVHIDQLVKHLNAIARAVGNAK